jgi:hypothetical protein
MQKQIEPTYLRYIYDSLSLNTIHKDNISALPEGLIGMYEEAFSNEQDVSSRERFLNFFSAWSLLKKEVSTSLMADLLDWEEWEVIDFISVYTKWFNSPSSGKYLLYHERLRVFFLQKISSHRFNQTNQTIISKCQLALEQRNGDEWEVYALEHLPSHLIIPAMQSETDGVVFKKLVYDTSFWNRQIEISKGYDWSKRMLNQSMTWAAKQNTDELIECALNKIDLHHMEQNDAPRIVELVAQNDIETALQRIESFGGNDKEGLQRKFILYMLCLMELTLLDSKDKPFRRDAIEKILKHFDEKMPVDHSVLNWDDFFSSYLMFLMACEWEVMQIDFLIVYKRTFSWENDDEWINLKGPFANLQWNVLNDIIVFISQNGSNINYLPLNKLALQAMRQGDVKLAFKVIDRISDDFDKSLTLIEISKELILQGKVEMSEDTIRYATETANRIDDFSDKEYALNAILNNKFFDSQNKKQVLKNENINIENISFELIREGKIQEALKVVNGFNCNLEIFLFLNNVIKKLAKNRDFQNAIEFTHGLKFNFWGSRTSVLNLLISELVKKNDNDLAFELLKESIEIEIKEYHKQDKITILKSVYNELFKNKKFNRFIIITQEVLKEVRLIKEGIFYEEDKNFPLIEISTLMYQYGDIEKYEQLLEEALTNARDCDNSMRIGILIKISSELYLLGKKTDSKKIISEAIESTLLIKDQDSINRCLKEISIELANQKDFQGAFNLAKNINDLMESISALLIISKEMAINGKKEKSYLLLEKLMQIVLETKEFKNKSYFKKCIVLELLRHEKIDDAKKIINQIEGEPHKSLAVCELIKKCESNHQKNESIILLKDILRFAHEIDSEPNKNSALIEISTELAKNNKWYEAEVVGTLITEKSSRQNCWRDIAKTTLDDKVAQNSLSLVFNFESSEAQHFFLKGWVEMINITDANSDLLQQAICKFPEDITSLESLLQNYALNQVFFEDIAHEKSQRFNRTLNIQWAIDIANNFNKN